MYIAHGHLSTFGKECNIWISNICAHVRARIYFFSKYALNETIPTSFANICPTSFLTAPAGQTCHGHYSVFLLNTMRQYDECVYIP